MGWNDPTSPPQDELFEIGDTIKGIKFSEKIEDYEFLKWVADLLAHNYATAHPQLKRFFKFCRFHGAYSGKRFIK